MLLSLYENLQVGDRVQVRSLKDLIKLKRSTFSRSKGVISIIIKNSEYDEVISLPIDFLGKSAVVKSRLHTDESDILVLKYDECGAYVSLCREFVMIPDDFTSIDLNDYNLDLLEVLGPTKTNKDDLTYCYDYHL